jgi:hypothetical protein
VAHARIGARFALKQRLLTAHVHWQQINALECLREDLLVQFHFLGQTLKMPIC